MSLLDFFCKSALKMRDLQTYRIETHAACLSLRDGKVWVAPVRAGVGLPSHLLFA